MSPIERTNKWRKENPEKVRLYNRERNRKYYQDNPEKVFKNRLRKFNLTIDDYNTMLKNQNYCCAICGLHENAFKKRLAVDHCHKTGQNRGLLCMSCNTAIGLLKEDSRIFEKARKYLQF